MCVLLEQFLVNTLIEMHGTSNFVKEYGKFMEDGSAKVFCLLKLVICETFLLYKKVRVPWVGRCRHRENENCIYWVSNVILIFILVMCLLSVCPFYIFLK